MITDKDRATVNAALDKLAEAIIVDLADSPEDEIVPIGRVLVEAFDAERRGYAVTEEMLEMQLTVADLRDRLRDMRGALALEAA